MKMDNVINADMRNQRWKQQARAYAAAKPDYRHDVTVVEDLINELTPWEKQICLSKFAMDILREDVTTVGSRGDRTSWSGWYTYLLECAKYKYGEAAVDINGWRAFSNRGEVIQYVRSLFKHTVDRIVMRKQRLRD